MRKQSQHSPVHLYADNAPYFITGAIYLKRCLLSSAESKIKLIKLIQGYFDKYEWELHHWVILDNHYHLLGKSKRGKDIPMIIKGIHSVSGKSILEDSKCAKPVWWNYWDYCPRDEEEYYTRLNMGTRMILIVMGFQVVRSFWLSWEEKKWSSNSENIRIIKQWF
jgi:putative transposase